ncbi:hypothetical protein BN11_290018 [Nostocoides australiense Ben110]|uniref:Uncharacterized protein n=1 Tax=Nostocoides australiense Ben110 TaxID=1193182 RepID=W6JY05_9MICO|nr:hypothetical protein BN11_290018 [Tetrasphaera australiensis Ben110]
MVDRHEVSDPVPRAGIHQRVPVPLQEVLEALPDQGCAHSVSCLLAAREHLPGHYADLRSDLGRERVAEVVAFPDREVSQATAAVERLPDVEDAPGEPDVVDNGLAAADLDFAGDRFGQLLAERHSERGAFLPPRLRVVPGIGLQAQCTHPLCVCVVVHVATLAVAPSVAVRHVRRAVTASVRPVGAWCDSSYMAKHLTEPALGPRFRVVSYTS